MDRLQKLREEYGLTQKQMGEKLGISESYYCQLENGKRRMSLPTAVKIASIFNKSLDDIFLPNDLAERHDQPEIA